MIDPRSTDPQSLVGAFPRALADDVATATAVMPAASWGPAGRFTVAVTGESVTIPDRIYNPEPDHASEAALTPRQKTILACIYTRHHDGWVRQRRLTTILSADDDTAIDDRLIASNPCRGVKVPRADRSQVIPLTLDQAQAMIEAAHPWFRAAIVIGAGLGLRQSEAAGLTLDRVDFLRRTVRVDRQWQQVSGTSPGAFNPPKTSAGVRVIPASPWVLEELASHVSRFGVGESSVIVHRDGQPLDAARWGHYVRDARRKAGVGPGVSFHDLRHLFASALIAAGCSVKQVQSALGHESAKVTLDVYGHLWPGDDDRVRDAVQRLSIASIGPSAVGIAAAGPGRK